MKSISFRHSERIAAALLAVALAVASAPAKAQSTESAAAPLEGTWRVQVTQYVCTNPTVRFSPFMSGRTLVSDSSTLMGQRQLVARQREFG
jgi:hypothetical protein